MIDETEEQKGVETKYLDLDRSGREQSGNHMDSHGKGMQPATLITTLKALPNGLACAQTVQFIGHQQSLVTFGTEGILVQISPMHSTSQRYILIPLRPRKDHLHRYSVLNGHSSER